MTTAKKIEVMQAFLDGKKIESRKKLGYSDIMSPYIPRQMDEREWALCIAEPSWSWGHTDYRVKKEPKEFLVAYREDTGMPVGVAVAGPHGFIEVSPRDIKLGTIKVMQVREVLE